MTKQLVFAFTLAAAVLSAQVTISTMAVDFSGAKSLRIPITCAATLDGHICYDPLIRFYRGYTNGVLRNLAFTDSSITGNAATATALAANGSNCPAGQVAAGVDAQGNAEGCTAAGAGGDMLASTYVQGGARAPLNPCGVAGAFYQDISVTPYALYVCGVNRVTWIGPFTAYDATKSGTLYLSGLTSGGAGWTVMDAAGSSILYAMPIWDGTTDLVGKVLVDTGIVHCGTISPSLAATTICHQLGWVTLTVSANKVALLK